MVRFKHKVAIALVVAASLSLLLVYGELSLKQGGNVLKAGSYAVLESTPSTPGMRPITLFIQWRLNQTHDRFIEVFAEDIVLSWRVIGVEGRVATIEVGVELVNTRVTRGFIYKMYSGVGENVLEKKVVSEEEVSRFGERGVFRVNLETMVIEGTDVSWPYMVKKDYIDSLKPLKLVDLAPPYYGSDLLPRDNSWRTIVVIVNSSKTRVEGSPVPKVAETFSNPIYIAWLKLGKPKILPPIIPKGKSISETLRKNTEKVFEESKKYRMLLSKLVYDLDTGLLVLIKYNYDLMIGQIGYTDYVLKTLFNADRAELWIYNKHIILKETNILANP